MTDPLRPVPFVPVDIAGQVEAEPPVRPSTNGRDAFLSETVAAGRGQAGGVDVALHFQAANVAEAEALVADFLAWQRSRPPAGAPALQHRNCVVSPEGILED